MRVLFIVGKKKICGSLKTLKFCKLQFLTLPTQKVADPWPRPIVCCILLPALPGVDISPRVWQVTILAMFSNF
jgi:hypothetical protein